jgi:hypothetical protein
MRSVLEVITLGVALALILMVVRLLAPLPGTWTGWSDLERILRLTLVEQALAGSTLMRLTTQPQRRRRQEPLSLLAFGLSCLALWALAWTWLTPGEPLPWALVWRWMTPIAPGLWEQVLWALLTATVLLALGLVSGLIATRQWKAMWAGLVALTSALTGVGVLLYSLSGMP